MNGYDRSKQEQLYKICHDFLIKNFPKFTEANTIKVAVVIASKYIPHTIEGGGGNTQIVVVRPDARNGKNGISLTPPDGKEMNVIRPAVAQAISG
jgi:hypothetical protein